MTSSSRRGARDAIAEARTARKSKPTLLNVRSFWRAETSAAEAPGMVGSGTTTVTVDCASLGEKACIRVTADDSRERPSMTPEILMLPPTLDDMVHVVMNGLHIFGVPQLHFDQTMHWSMMMSFGR